MEKLFFIFKVSSVGEHRLTIIYHGKKTTFRGTFGIKIIDR